MPKIVFLDAATLTDLPDFDRFRGLGEFTAYDRSAPAEVEPRLAGAQVAITNKVPFPAERIAALPDLRLICVAATGTNHIDAAAATARGIPVRNVAGYSTNSVAQYTLTALLSLATDLHHLNDFVHSGAYARQPDFSAWRRPYYELRGKTFGIVGLGTIGRAVADLAVAYGARVVYHSISGEPKDVPYPALPLGELLAESDVVSLHCALSDQTRGLLTYDELRRMRPTAYLVNAARGGVVDEGDLARALDAGLLAGAVVDVFSAEPPPPDHPYLRLTRPERLLLTPHVAWASVEARTALLRGIRDNIAAGW